MTTISKDHPAINDAAKHVRNWLVETVPEACMDELAHSVKAHNVLIPDDEDWLEATDLVVERTYELLLGEDER